MLALASRSLDERPEEVELDLAFDADASTQDYTSAWFGHPLVLRGIMRNGLEVALGLSMTECVRLLLALEADAALANWAETMRVVHSGRKPS